MVTRRTPGRSQRIRLAWSISPRQASSFSDWARASPICRSRHSREDRFSAAAYASALAAVGVASIQETRSLS